MPNRKNIKVIFDTNIWISFLIGKRLQVIKDLIIEQKLEIILSDQLLLEIQLVTQRPKLKKYFPENKVEELIQFLEIVGKKFEVKSLNDVSRDSKDNFLLDLIDASKADYLVTGDKDLLILNPFNKTKILTPAEFEKELNK